MGLETAPAVVEPEKGSLYSLGKGHDLTKHLDKITISNGMAWTSDNKAMFYVDSYPRSVYAFDFDLQNGTVSNQRTVVDFNKTPGYNDFAYPDGLTIDLNEKSWLACYDAGVVLNIDPTTEKHQWMCALFFSCVILYAARMAMPITIPIISRRAEWTKTNSGTVLSSFFWGYSLTQVVGGYMSDRFGGEVVLFITTIGWAALTFFTPEMIFTLRDRHDALFMVSFGRIMIGALQGFHFPALASIISKNIHNSEKTFFSGVVTSGPAFGMLLNGSMGSIILERYGWIYVFRVLGMLGLSWVLIVWYLLFSQQTASHGQIAASSSRTISKVPWSTFFWSPAFWSMLFAHFCHNNFFFILLSWLPTYFKEKYPFAKGWVFNVMPWIIAPVSCTGGGWIAEKMITRGWDTGTVRKIMEAISELTTAVLMVIFTSLESYSAALICLTIAVASSSFHNSGVFINSQDIAPQYAGSILGITNSVGAIPGFVGVYVTGYILEVWQNWTVVFILTAMLNIVGCVGFIIFGTGKPLVRNDLPKS